jgi:hypothetical protein
MRQHPVGTIIFPYTLYLRGFQRALRMATEILPLCEGDPSDHLMPCR